MKTIQLLTDVGVAVDLEAPTTLGTILMGIALLMFVLAAFCPKRVLCGLIATALIIALIVRWLSPGTFSAWVGFATEQFWTLFVAAAIWLVAAFTTKK